MRTIGLDVHKRFAEAAILEPGRPLRDELGPDDQVILEATFNTWQLTDLLRARVRRVVVSNPMKTKAIASAKVKTDKVDAEILARLLASEFVAEVWVPDAQLRALRRRLSHRFSLVRQRTQLRNRIHAVVGRNLLNCPYTDLFGKAGLPWLAQQELPADERAVVDGTQRLLTSLETEIEALDRPLAEHALGDPRVQHLVTIPGVGLVTTLALVAVIGDIHRFSRPNQLAGTSALIPACGSRGRRQPASATSVARARAMPEPSWSRQRFPRCVFLDRYVRFTNESEIADGARSQWSRSPGSWRCSPGTC